MTDLAMRENTLKGTEKTMSGLKISAGSNMEKTPNFQNLILDIAKFMVRFHGRSKNLYWKFVDRLAELDPHVHYSTLNYDLILDDYLVDRMGYSYYNPTDLTSNKVYFKLHGSCNFFPQRIDLRSDWFDTAPGSRAFTGEGSHPNPETISLKRTTLIKEYAKLKYPIVSQYFAVREKTSLFASDYLEKMREDWKKTLDGADTVVIAGVNFNSSDAHIWNPLLQNKEKLIYLTGTGRNIPPGLRTAQIIKKGFSEDGLKKLMSLINVS